MDPYYRERFNDAFSDELYARYRRDLERRVGQPVEFRLAETPMFLPSDFLNRLILEGREIVETISRPEMIERMSNVVPEQWKVPRPQTLPSFA